MDDTPKGQGLGSLGDMPSDTSNPLGDITTTPQRGLPRAVTDPSGRTVTTTYDGYGQPVCSQVSFGSPGSPGSVGGAEADEADGAKGVGGVGSSGTGGAAGGTAGANAIGTGGGSTGGTAGAGGSSGAGGDGDRWSCIDSYDDMLRTTQSTTRSPDGSATQTVTNDYWGSSNDPLTTVTTDKDAGVSLTQKLDWAGSLADYTDGIGTQTTYTYDNMGRPLSQTITLPTGSQGGPYKYESAYDSATGLLTSTTLNGKALVDMKYDSVTAEHPSQIASYTYLDDKLVDTPQRDEYNRPIGQAWTNSNGSSVLDETFTRTAAGTLTDDTLTTQGKTGKYAYTYDTARRLATANVADHKYAYTWDSNTNMVGQSIDGAKYTYTYDAGDRLISSTDPKVKPATSDTFDANGNYANLNNQAYTYDANQRLTSISGGGTGQGASNQEPALAYVRDPLGRPTQTTDQGKTTTLSYVSPSDQIPAVYTDKATGNSTPIVSLPGGLIHTPSNNWITDTQGHAALVLDDNATPLDGTIQQWQPYGQPATTMTPVSGPNPGWHGMPADLNGTIIDLGARTLHTNLTLFTQPDPIHGGSGAGPHNYTPGDPINAQDLDGTVSKFRRVGRWIARKWNAFWNWILRRPALQHNSTSPEAHNENLNEYFGRAVIKKRRRMGIDAPPQSLAPSRSDNIAKLDDGPDSENNAPGKEPNLESGPESQENKTGAQLDSKEIFIEGPMKNRNSSSFHTVRESFSNSYHTARESFSEDASQSFYSFESHQPSHLSERQPSEIWDID